MRKNTASHKNAPRGGTASEPGTGSLTGASSSFTRLAKNARLEVTVSALDEEGCGTVRTADGMTLRVSGALPGDSIVAAVDHVSRGTAFAHVHRMLGPSTVRSKRPPCTESSACLGCPLICMKYSEQKNWKRGMVRAEMSRYPELKDVVVHPVLSPDNLIHYRTVAKLAVAGKCTDPFIGIYRRASHDVYDLEGCSLHNPLINRVVDAARAGIRKLKVPVYNPHSRMGLLRYLVVRVSLLEKKAMVVFVTSRRSYNEIHHLGRFVQERVPEVDVVVQNVNGSEGNVIFGHKDHFLTPRHHLTEKIGDVMFQISPRSFFQVNPAAARLIYGQVSTWAGESPLGTVLDLYCGIGGIGLFLAAGAQQVIGYEYVEEAVADARLNARANGFANCTFESGDVADLLEDLAEECHAIDLAVLNPPRKGCDEAVLRRLAGLAPRALIYVSCSPATLCRDLSLLQALGYSCREIQPVDMFPQTVHVECVARLEKNLKKSA